MKITYVHNVAEQIPVRFSPDLLVLWWRRHTTRRQLKLMLQQDSERLYNDLGLSDEALKRECNKWFWKD